MNKVIIIIFIIMIDWKLVLIKEKHKDATNLSARFRLA